ncbi:hypothetical protein DL93DRAFT_1667792 [Clavulina sp. PMI_390]|nr:hypothetical protein DL93DRAFT_1667792 [Clavulina sp. PMI_390]
MGNSTFDLNYERLRSLSAFLRSLDHLSADGATKVPTRLESLAVEYVASYHRSTLSDLLVSSYSLGLCDRNLFELEKMDLLLQTAQKWLREDKARTNVLRKRAQNRMLLISRLPDEVLSEIFLLSMAPSDCSVWAEPVLAICSKWRQCALSSPKLWCFLCIHERTEPSELALWLSRSRRMPLHVTMEFPAIPDNQRIPESTVRHFQMMEPLLGNSLWRITSVPLDEVLMTGWIPCSLLQTDSLRTLRCIYSSSQPDPPTPPAPSLSEVNLEKLQILELTSGVVEGVSLISPRFASLTYIRLHSTVCVETAWKIFAQCSELETIKWRARLEADPDWEEALPEAYGLEAPTLLKLQDVELFGDACAIFFRAAVTPNVRSIGLHARGLDLDDIFSNISSVEQPHVRKISLNATSELSAKDISAILELSSLEELDCDSWNSQSLNALKCLNEFEVDPKGTWAWKAPLLKRLGIGFKGGKSARAGLEKLRTDLVSVLEALANKRARGPQSILHIHVKDPRLELPSYEEVDHWAAVHVTHLGPACMPGNEAEGEDEDEEDDSDNDEEDEEDEEE